MRAGRLLSILLSLQLDGRATAQALAAELEVSPRTVHRDMEALAMAGVPVYAERGRHGGWLLADGYRVGPPGLHADELRALFLATPGTVLGDLGLDRASESALTKLLLALPAAARRGMRDQRQKVLVDAGNWRAVEREPVPCLPVLQEALWSDRKVQIGYERADGGVIERLVDPLGLVAKGLIWYLVAGVDAGEPRTYRVSRMRSARLTDTDSAAPADFDLAAFWAASKNRLVAGVPRFQVRLLAEREAVSEFAARGRWSHVEHVGTSDPDGRVYVEMTFELEEDVCAFVLGFGSRVELLEPDALRRRIAAQAAAIVGLHAARPQ
jgi:predicted DNA-binding transcriptional regulator YafY